MPLKLRPFTFARIRVSADVPGAKSTKEHHLNLSRQEKEVPPCGMNFAIEGKAVQQLYHAPVS
jgi:hypothetical protein